MMEVQRFNVKDVFRDDTKRLSSGTNRVVGKKYLDTPARAKGRVIIRAMGFFSFTLTVITLISILTYSFFPSLHEIIPGEAFTGLMMVLLLANHFGLFVEMAADGLGANWFARGAGLMWLTLFGYCLIGSLIHLIKPMFS